MLDKGKSKAKNIPAMPYKVRELGITDDQWQHAHLMPLVGGPKDIAMLLRISPRLLLEANDQAGTNSPDMALETYSWSSSLARPEEDYSRRLPFIKLELVDPNPYQSTVRTEYDAREIDEVIQQLTRSFRKGDLSAFVLHLRPNPLPGSQGRYQLIYGHLRLEAARRIGIEVLPGVISHEVPDQQMFRQLVDENEQRCQPSIVSIAQQVRFAIEHFNWRLAPMAGIYHRSEKFISMLYRLSYAPPPFLQFVHDHEDFARVVTEMLELRLDQEQQVRVLAMLKEPEVTPGRIRQHLTSLALPALASKTTSSSDTSPKVSGAEVVEAVYREYHEHEHEYNQPDNPLKEMGRGSLQSSLHNSPSNRSLNQITTPTATAYTYANPKPYEPYIPKTARPLHLAPLAVDAIADGENEAVEETFTPMTSFEKSLLERLDSTVRQIETLSAREGLSDQFSLKLIETSQRFTKFL